MIYDKNEIKKMFESKLSFLSNQMRNYLMSIKKTDGVDGLLKLKEWLDNTDTTDELYFSKEYDDLKKTVYGAMKADSPISESNNLFASKIDTNVFDTDNNPSVIYRGEYFYLLNKDEYNSYISSASNKKTKKKYDYIIDNDTFMKNFVTINKESTDELSIACPNCEKIFVLYPPYDANTCPYCDLNSNLNQDTIRKTSAIVNSGIVYPYEEPSNPPAPGNGDGGVI